MVRYDCARLMQMDDTIYRFALALKMTLACLSVSKQRAKQIYNNSAGNIFMQKPLQCKMLHFTFASISRNIRLKTTGFYVINRVRQRCIDICFIMWHTNSPIQIISEHQHNLYGTQIFHIP